MVQNVSHSNLGTYGSPNVRQNMAHSALPMCLDCEWLSFEPAHGIPLAASNSDILGKAPRKREMWYKTTFRDPYVPRPMYPTLLTCKELGSKN